MAFAILLLLLALIGFVPPQYALPLAMGSVIFGAVTFWSMQRRLAGIPMENGAEAMVGSVAPALTNIGHDGQIQYGNEIWNARTLAGPIPKGQTVRIINFEGLRAMVVPEASPADS